MLLQSTSYLFEVCIFIAKQISFNVLTSVPLPPFCVTELRKYNTGGPLIEINPQHE